MFPADGWYVHCRLPGVRATSLTTLLFCTAIVTGTAARGGQSELAEAGWKALRNGNAERAASIFAEGLEQAPDDPGLQLGAGSAAHARGRQREAMARLER